MDVRRVYSVTNEQSDAPRSGLPLVLVSPDDDPDLRKLISEFLAASMGCGWATAEKFGGDAPVHAWNCARTS